MTALQFAALGAASFAGSAVAGVAGFGMAGILMPLAVAFLGVKTAMPLLTVVSILANASRAWVNRGDLHLPVAGWFLVGAAPATVAGALLFVWAPAGVLTRILGVVMLAMVGWRYWRPGFVRAGLPRMPLRGFALLGIVVGLFNGVLAGLKALTAPFYLSYGLVKGAFVGTSAAITVVTGSIKLATFGATDLLTPHILTVGLLLGPFVFAGSLVGRKVLERLPERVFVRLIEAIMVVAGLNFLLRG